MTGQYGPFSDIVALAGSLMGAAWAIGLAFTGRARWLPPEEDLSGSVARVSALMCAVAIAILYVFGRDAIGLVGLAWIAGVCVGVTIMALLVSIYLNTVYSFEKVVYTGKKAHRTRVLGGFSLTQEAIKIRDERSKSVQELFKEGNYDRDLVWTKASCGMLKVASTIGYLFLQASGSIGLAAAALLVRR